MFRQDWHENKNDVILKLCRKVCSERTEVSGHVLYTLYWYEHFTQVRSLCSFIKEAFQKPLR